MSEDPFEDQLVIKMEPEIRHAFAHLYYAIEALAHGRRLSALDNLHAVESLIMFDGDEDDWENYYKGRVKPNGEVQEQEVQGQEEVQGEEVQG